MSGRISKENREVYIYISKKGEFDKGGSRQPLGSKEAIVFVAAALQKNINTPDSILGYAQKLGYSIAPNELEAAMAACAAPLSRSEG